MFADERLESYFTGLGGVAEEYGLNHWGRLKNETDQPRLEDYPGLTADEAQQVRFAVLRFHSGPDRKKRSLPFWNRASAQQQIQVTK
jgi:hypothetical protein